MKDTAKTGGKSCPVEWTLEVIGGKWKCVILWHKEYLEPSYRICRWNLCGRHIRLSTALG